MNANATTASLPEGSHYAVMWGIPDLYAGMTNSMLHRCRAFVELAGTDVTIVTYEYRPDYDVVRTRLRDRGAMIDGMHLINLWEDMRSWDDAKLRGVSGAKRFVAPDETLFIPLGERGDQSDPLRHTLHDRAGKVLQVDYFRPDGTLLASDRLDVPGPKSRAFTLCDTSGQPIGTWQKIWELYWSWLDSLPREPIAWFIADSKTSANHMVDYHRDDAVVIHVVHGSHLTPGTGRPHGQLVESRRKAFERLDHWDGVVFLTRHQLDEVDILLGPGDNRHVIPHGRHVPASPPELSRSSLNGVMLTSLSKRKQIGHAIKAMAKAGRVGWRKPHLDVFGQGAQEKSLRLLIARHRANVDLRGYSDDAAREFDTASFSLLTSSNEAFGLVLVESMGHGCIPISYDMPYGPAEIITDGVDGFLVPADDINALAAAIRRITRMKPAELAPMREAAHRRALAFNDEHVTARWAVVMQAALDAKRVKA